MRILHLVSYPIFSGPLPPTLGLALAQRRLGHEVYLAIDSKRLAPNDYEEAAAPRLQDLRLAPPEPLTLSTKSSLVEIWRDRRRLARLAAERVDVVHAHMSHDHVLALMAGVRRRVPLVRTLHAPRSLGTRFGQRWLNRRADGWIARCAAHQQRLAEQTGASIRIIPGGIDADAFVPAAPAQKQAARRALGIPTGARVIVQVALIAGRGQEELAGAVVRVNSPHLHILYVGRGENEEALALLCEGIGLADKAHFSGYLTGDALRRAYAAADAAFIAQPGNDASARAALEAMASGLPVVGVGEEALAELVTPEVGYPVASRAPERIAEALKIWLADDAAGERGMAARRWVVERRSFRKEAEEVLAFYRELFTGRVSQPRSAPSEV